MIRPSRRMIMQSVTVQCNVGGVQPGIRAVDVSVRAFAQIPGAAAILTECDSE
jgi:hypothetical protein